MLKPRIRNKPRQKIVSVFVDGTLDRKYQLRQGVWQQIEKDYNLSAGYFVDLWLGDEIHEHGKVIHTKILNV